jgi:nucleotide-binding universal stress UspA family protein
VAVAVHCLQQAYESTGGMIVVSSDSRQRSDGKKAMFKKITVAYNESAEASRALASAIHLAKALGAELRAITIMEDAPAYTAYATAADSSLARSLAEDRRERYELLHAEARETASREGVELVTDLLEGEEAGAILRFLLDNKTDLLVIGLHRKTSHISRLWSTVFEVAQDAPCSVLGVH